MLKGRIRIVAGIGVLAFAFGLVAGSVGSWLLREANGPGVYCLALLDPSDREVRLHPARSGCDAGSMCVFVERGVVSETVYATDCGPQP
jgi:hypothetical protein